MTNSAFNPHISIENPFPAMELPSLFVWTDRVRAAVADDSVPDQLAFFMSYMNERLASPDLLTFGISKDGEVGGYFEAITHVREDSPLLDEELSYIAQCSVLFKRDLWGKHLTRTAMNLCLQKVFEAGIETAFFRCFMHNHPLRSVFWSVGARTIGPVTPRKQRGINVPTELYALPATAWEQENADFLAAQRNAGETPKAIAEVSDLTAIPV